MERTVRVSLEAVQKSVDHLLDSFFPDNPNHLFKTDGLEIILRKVQHSTHFQTPQLFYISTFLYLWICAGIPQRQKYNCSQRISDKYFLFLSIEHHPGITLIGVLHSRS